jgi:hypothetical protein
MSTTLPDENRAEYENALICAHWPVCLPGILRIYLITDSYAYQYTETNTTHFLFNLLRINDLYMFRALLPHTQEALHKRHFVYCLRGISDGCTTVNPGTGI